MIIPFLSRSIAGQYGTFPAEQRQRSCEFYALSCIEDSAAAHGQGYNPDVFSALLDLSYKAWLSCDDSTTGINFFACEIADAYYSGTCTLDFLHSLSKYDLCEACFDGFSLVSRHTDAA